MLRVLLSLILFFQICILNANAISASEYCKIHNDSGVPGTCTVCDKDEMWAIVRDNLGNDICKKCGDGGCTKTECSECKDYPKCVEE